VYELVFCIGYIFWDVIPLQLIMYYHWQNFIIEVASDEDSATTHSSSTGSLSQFSTVLDTTTDNTSYRDELLNSRSSVPLVNTATGHDSLPSFQDQEEPSESNRRPATMKLTENNSSLIGIENK